MKLNLKKIVLSTFTLVLFALCFSNIILFADSEQKNNYMVLKDFSMNNLEFIEYVNDFSSHDINNIIVSNSSKSVENQKKYVRYLISCKDYEKLKNYLAENQIVLSYSEMKKDEQGDRSIPDEYGTIEELRYHISNGYKNGEKTWIRKEWLTVITGKYHINGDCEIVCV